MNIIFMYNFYSRFILIVIDFIKIPQFWGSTSTKCCVCMVRNIDIKAFKYNLEIA